MDFFLQFPPHKSKTQQKKRKKTQQPKKGLGLEGRNYLVPFHCSVEFFDVGIMGCFKITFLQIQIPPKIESHCWNCILELSFICLDVFRFVLHAIRNPRSLPRNRWKLLNLSCLRKIVWVIGVLRRTLSPFNTCRNIRQQCCKMLRWNVASVWPGLYIETRSRNQCHAIVPHENHPCSANPVPLLFHCLNSRIENYLTLRKSQLQSKSSPANA